jgi:GT2 family glycosyltransferase
MTSVGCVVLSQGTRPAELSAALASVLAQRDVEVDVVVVGNGWVPKGLPSGVRSVALPDNVGIPAGRNVGAAETGGDVLLFLDDDAELVGDRLLTRAVAAFDDDPRLGVVQLRALDPAGAPTSRRHVPRLRAADPARAGDVAWFWEGASLIRRSAFDDAGGWPGSFFYGHEGIEVAWRVVDAGYRVHYAAELEVLNPEAAPFRGERHRYLDARNRVWVAKRNLPAPLVVGYLAVWGTATLLRARSSRDLRAACRGFADGVRLSGGERRPIRWRTAWRLTTLGRPPVV